MKRTLFYVMLAFLVMADKCSWAALRFGLGSAVAKRSAGLIDIAGTNDPVNAAGDTVADTLPSCPAGSVYDTVPTDLSQISAIDPLGHVAPPPHTFPSDHIYFYRNSTSVSAIPIYAPGTIHITRIASSEVLTASPVFTDYGIYFYPCRELKSYFAHVRTLSASLQRQIGSIDQDCTTYTTGGTFHACNKNTNIVVQSGELLGFAELSGAFDFGSYDYRRTPLAFVSPSRHPGDQPYTVCPLDYFTGGPKGQMEALLGRFDGSFHRTVAPLCGGTMFDVAGTARGAWYHPGSPDVPEDPHLSLIQENADATKQVISVGNSLTGQSPGIFAFFPVSAGQVDRDFTQVTPDGALYCYDTFYGPDGRLSGGSSVFLIQLLSAATLRIESQSLTACGSGPWSLTSNAVTFQR